MKTLVSSTKMYACGKATNTLRRLIATTSSIGSGATAHEPNTNTRLSTAKTTILPPGMLAISRTARAKGRGGPGALGREAPRRPRGTPGPRIIRAEQP